MSLHIHSPFTSIHASQHNHRTTTQHNSQPLIPLPDIIGSHIEGGGSEDHSMGHQRLPVQEAVSFTEAKVQLHTKGRLVVMAANKDKL